MSQFLENPIWDKDMALPVSLRTLVPILSPEPLQIGKIVWDDHYTLLPLVLSHTGVPLGCLVATVNRAPQYPHTLTPAVSVVNLHTWSIMPAVSAGRHGGSHATDPDEPCATVAAVRLQVRLQVLPLVRLQ